MSTDADVLSIRVHLAAMREQQIRRTHEAEVAKAALNESIGLPFDTPHQLSTPLAVLGRSPMEQGELEKRAASERPEAREAALAREIAEARERGARAAFLPQAFARAAFEADRGRFVTQAGANWYFSAGIRWNLFDGFANSSRSAEAGHMAAAARAREKQMASAVQLQVRQAHASLQSARERIEVAGAAESQAAESLRILKNRFEAGLSTVTELLRAEVAVLEARMRRLAAIHDQRIAAAMVELAAGTLTGDSYVLQ
jgi:outer membrane protein TolC